MTVHAADMLRTSERTSFKRCRWAWWWAYAKELQPERPANALRFGTMVHKAMELRYPPGRKRGPHPAVTFEELYASEVAEMGKMGHYDDEGEWADLGATGVGMLNNFVDAFGTDEEYEVISSEQTFQVPFWADDPDQAKLKTWVRTGNVAGVPDFWYVGTFDGVWRHRATKKLLFIDWKTAASISTQHLPLDEQAGSYWTFGPPWLHREGILTGRQKLSYILYTFLRKAVPDARPRNSLGQALNKDGSVSKSQPPPFFHREIVYRDTADRDNLRFRVGAEHAEMEMVRQGELEVYKNPGHFTCMGCGYKDMCELHEAGADWGVMRDTLVHWDPYDAHEIEEEGKK